MTALVWGPLWYHVVLLIRLVLCGSWWFWFTAHSAPITTLCDFEDRSATSSMGGAPHTGFEQGARLELARFFWFGLFLVLVPMAIQVQPITLL